MTDFYSYDVFVEKHNPIFCDDLEVIFRIHFAKPTAQTFVEERYSSALSMATRDAAEAHYRRRGYTGRMDDKATHELLQPGKHYHCSAGSRFKRPRRISWRDVFRFKWQLS